MGFATGAEGGAPSGVDPAAAEDEEEGNDDESIVHQTASVGDAEVCAIVLCNEKLWSTNMLWDSYIAVPQCCNFFLTLIENFQQSQN